jgi:hypothetical protein
VGGGLLLYKVDVEEAFIKAHVIDVTFMRGDWEN